MLLFFLLSLFCSTFSQQNVPVLPESSTHHRQVLPGPKVAIRDYGEISFNKASLQQFVSDLAKGKYKDVDDVYKSFDKGEKYLLRNQLLQSLPAKRSLDKILLLRRQEIKQMLEKLKNGSFEDAGETIVQNLVTPGDLNSTVLKNAILIDTSSCTELLTALKGHDRNGSEKILSRYSLMEQPPDPNYDPNSKLVVINRDTLGALLKQANLNNLDQVKRIMNNKVIQLNFTIEQQQTSENSIAFSEVMMTKLTRALVQGNMEQFRSIISKLITSGGATPTNDEVMLSFDVSSLVELMAAIKNKNLNTTQSIIYKHLFPSKEYQAKLAQLHKNALLVLEPTTKDILSTLQMNKLDLLELIFNKLFNDVNIEQKVSAPAGSEYESMPPSQNPTNP